MRTVVAMAPLVLLLAWISPPSGSRTAMRAAAFDVHGPSAFTPEGLRATHGNLALQRLNPTLGAAGATPPETSHTVLLGAALVR